MAMLNTPPADQHAVLGHVPTLVPEAVDACHTEFVAVSRAERRAERRGRVVDAVGGGLTEPALDLLELVELAWHDCYGDITPPEQVIDDILLLSRGDLTGLISAAHLAVSDWRDARVAADKLRH